METTFQVTRILALATFAFLVAFFSTPALTHFLYKYKLGKAIRDEGKTPIFTKLHEKKQGTPTMGGILIWLTTVILIGFFWFGAKLFFSNTFLEAFNFLSRKETFLPLGAIISSAVVGLGDDILGVFRTKRKMVGFKVWHRIFLYTLIAAVGAWWFYSKLDWTELRVPLVGNIDIGILYVPYFIFVIVATAFSTNETDGLDGLAGGVLLIGFASYGAISFFLGRYDLAAFCAVITGALIAFLWFNVYPARFFMGDTGAMSLGITLGIIAMLTNYSLLLPLIAFILVLESLSVIIQAASKKLFGRKAFLSTPIHHHFEARGWPETKVTMRFWIISAVTASIGLIVFLLDRGI